MDFCYGCKLSKFDYLICLASPNNRIKGRVYGLFNEDRSIFYVRECCLLSCYYPNLKLGHPAITRLKLTIDMSDWIIRYSERFYKFPISRNDTIEDPLKPTTMSIYRDPMIIIDIDSDE